MKYFRIKTTTEKIVIGTEYPQIQTMDGTVDRNNPDSLYNVYPDDFPSFTPNLDFFKLHKKAKLTDVLSASMIDNGFIVNEKVRTILESAKLPPNRFYPASIMHNKYKYDNYFWFFYISDVFDFINYKKTAFYITDMVDNKIEACLEVRSSDALKKLTKSLPIDRNINSDLIFFNHDLMDTYDLIKVTLGNYNTYVSQRLYDLIVQNNISGFQLSEAQKIVLN